MRIHYLFLGLLILGTSCGVSSQNELKELDRQVLQIDEPSGITTDGTHFFIVSDRNGKVFKTDFKGGVLEVFDTGHKDLEGITFNKESDQFALVSESKRKVYQFDAQFNEISDYKIKGKQDSKNSGLESIAFSRSNNSFYVANEKNPKQFLRLGKDFEVVNEVTVEFLDDISGLCYDEVDDLFWMVSDESRRIYSVSTEGKLLASYKIKLKKVEGIVCFENKLAVVSDAAEVLVIFEKPR